MAAGDARRRGIDAAFDAHRGACERCLSRFEAEQRHRAASMPRAAASASTMRRRRCAACSRAAQRLCGARRDGVVRRQRSAARRDGWRCDGERAAQARRDGAPRPRRHRQGPRGRSRGRGAAAPRASAPAGSTPAATCASSAPPTVPIRAARRATAAACAASPRCATAPSPPATSGRRPLARLPPEPAHGCRARQRRGAACLWADALTKVVVAQRRCRRPACSPARRARLAALKRMTSAEPAHGALRASPRRAGSA